MYEIQVDFTGGLMLHLKNLRLTDVVALVSLFAPGSESAMLNANTTAKKVENIFIFQPQKTAVK